MEPQQLHSNPPHTLDISFYDHHHRHEDMARARETDLLNTIISFPSPSSQQVLLHRNSLQDRRMSPGSSSSFLFHSTTSTTPSLEVGASRNELLQLRGRPDLCESTGLTGREKLRHTLPAAITSRFQEESILSRLNPNSQLGGADGVAWQTYADVNDIAGSTSAPSNDTLQLPVNMNLGVHSMLSNMLPISSDQRSYGHRRNAMWADDHGTELLLLPGISAASDEHTHQQQHIIPAHKQPGNASDQDRQQSSSFSGVSTTYASTSGGSLRDLSLSLSARENSQHALFGVRGFLTAAGSTGCSQNQSSTYFKAAQNALREECSKAIAAGAAAARGGSLAAKSNPICSNTAGVAASAIVSNEISFASGAGAAGAINMNAQQSDILRSSHQYHHPQQQQQVPAAMAHLQLQDHYGRVQAYCHNGGNQLLQPAMMVDRPQQLELKRRKLYIMLEELEKRFKKYEEHMQMLLIELETSGVGMMLEGSAPYKEAAERAIQNRFTCLRDSILASESFAMGAFSGHDGGAHQAIVQGVTPGECDQVGNAAAATRFRLLDQQLRHQRALQQVGLFPQPPWRPQRGLPERSVSLLRAWLFDHFLHPYPKDTEKVLLARQTGLTRNQVSNWFINARVRLWKPMVEEMYQEEMKTAELRRAGGQGNLIKATSTSHAARGTTGTSDAHQFHMDQPKKHMQSNLDNHLMAIQDMSSINAMQSVEPSRFFYKQGDFINEGGQPRQFQAHQEEVSFSTGMEVPTPKAAMAASVLEATHTWPFIQHPHGGAFDAQEQQQHYCSSDISTALMRFGGSAGVTLTLGLQQHSGGGGGGGGGGGSINCAGPPFERSADDVNAAHHRWCE
ncbi:hypothetical protein GOP47_0024689 [Adiantum capillus-veneris]|uniref:Homeobox domain-containing protein n=1 Tax=Adiantum capillus-veneris TaxID=13818 RepID=A0A9D4U4H9_ADICA|nr:hypothetical protein GOP47_0024689 [Adiantum capillus-veneris]